MRTGSPARAMGVAHRVLHFHGGHSYMIEERVKPERKPTVASANDGAAKKQ
jgi:hypothetical protein